jgi:drug/metabolite transporter (DMT)-like permease
MAFAVLLYVGNVLFFSAMVDAPNPGLSRAILSLEVVATTVMGFMFASKSGLTIKQGAGMIAIMVGTYVVVSDN